MADRRAVLVTGGAGYIGSHACKALHAAGFLPITYDNLVHGHEWAVQWGPLVKGDICDAQGLAAAVTQYRPVAIIHFAAFAYVGESVTDPGKYYANNVAGSLALLEVLRDHGPDAIVFSSSCAVYGVPDRLPIAETAPRRPINPYGRTKLAVEDMLADFETAHGLRSISLRYFNAAGADPDLTIGEDHDPETHLVPLVLDAAAGRRDAVTLYGEDYATPDGTCIRDYAHVCDLAQAHVGALEALLAGARSNAFNLGNGEGFSVRQIIAAAQAVTGKTVPVRLGPRRPGDPACLVADATRAREMLGWKPQYSGLDTILGSAWAWHRHHFATGDVACGRIKTA